MFTKIKTITNRNPAFLKVAYAADDLIDLQNDERFIAPGERYIVWNAGLWRVMRMQPCRVGTHVGSAQTIYRAVYLAAV